MTLTDKISDGLAYFLAEHSFLPSRPCVMRLFRFSSLSAAFSVAFRGTQRVGPIPQLLFKMERFFPAIHNGRDPAARVMLPLRREHAGLAFQTTPIFQATLQENSFLFRRFPPLCDLHD